MVAFKELGLISRAALLATLHTLLNGCNGAVCKEGTADCPCADDESCEAGLVCEERVCKVDDSDSGARKPPKTEDGEDRPGTGGSGASAGAEGDGSEEPDGSSTGGTGANDPGEDGAAGARDDEPDEDAGASGSGNTATGGSGGTDNGEIGGSAGSGADSGNGGSDNPSSGGSGGMNTGGTNAGGAGGGLAGSGGATTEPVPFPVACWGCAIEGCAEPMNDCRNDGTCDACITTSYIRGLCEENAAYSELAECFCNNFCAARCTDVCE